MIASVIGKVFVFSPNKLRDEFTARYPDGEVPSSLGNFGNPPYGRSLIGRVFVPVDSPNGCNTLTPIQFDADPELANTPILLLDRGECPFVVKVRHAEDIGAKLVIIANDQNSDINNIIMTDNGKGGNLNIPAILISKEDSYILKKYLNDYNYKNHVTLSVNFEIKTSRNQIKYSFWSTPAKDNSRYFLMDFASIASQFEKNVAVFEPHYLFTNCYSCEYQRYKIADLNCLSGGRYCAEDPDKEGSLTGRDVVLEELRQICLFQQANMTNNKDYSLWFKYQIEYFLQCSKNLFELSCSEKVIQKINGNEANIKKCIKESFEGEDVSLADNSILRKEKEE